VSTSVWRRAAWRAGAGAASLTALALPGLVQAGAWNTEPSVSLSSEYSSNPRLLQTDTHAVESAAATVTLPATYTGVRQTLDLRPQLRAAATHGDTELISDFQYLDASWRVNWPTQLLQLSSFLHHDSTLYNQYENGALLAATQRRTEQNATLDWQNRLTERVTLRTDLSYDRVAYGQLARSGLSDYRYLQASLGLSRDLSERTLWTLSAGSSRYDLIDQDYRNDNPFVRMTLASQLSEAWTLTVGAGASSLRARSQFGPYVSGSRRTLPNFNLALEHHDPHGAMSFTLSRSIQPSGFGALLTQDNLTLMRSATWSERWSGSAALRASRQLDSLRQLNLGDRRYYSGELTANWLWREQLTLSAELGFSTQRYASNLPQPSSTAVYLTLTRQFYRKPLH